MYWTLKRHTQRPIGELFWRETTPSCLQDGLATLDESSKREGGSVTVLWNLRSRQMYTTYSSPETVISLLSVLDSPSLMSHGLMGQNALRGLEVRSPIPLVPFFDSLYFTHTSPSRMHAHPRADCIAKASFTYTPELHSNCVPFPNRHFISTFSGLEPQCDNIYTITTSS